MKHFKSYSTLKNTLVHTTAGIQGLASSEQTRRVTDWRREGDGRWWSWRIISNRRWWAGCSFTHIWQRWNTCSYLWKFAAWRFVCRGPTVHTKSGLLSILAGAAGCGEDGVWGAWEAVKATISSEMSDKAYAVTLHVPVYFKWSTKTHYFDIRRNALGQEWKTPFKAVHTFLSLWGKAVVHVYQKYVWVSNILCSHGADTHLSAMLFFLCLNCCCQKE